ncbi:MAG: RNA pseudouridine synthase [Pseudomonadales bacterium]
MLHRSDDLVVVNKPADVSLLADRSGAACLWDALPELLGARPYLVHRLDKPTSGVLAVALNPESQRRLTRLFQSRAVRKYYLAGVTGHPLPAGRIDLPLRKGRKSRYRVAGPRSGIVEHDGHFSLAHPTGDGHPSLTRFRRLAQSPTHALLLLAPRTGRTHQLRVHLAWIGHPILGDRLYGAPGDPSQQAPRLMLHAHRLVLPGFGSFSAPLDMDPRTWMTAGPI